MCLQLNLTPWCYFTLPVLLSQTMITLSQIFLLSFLWSRVFAVVLPCLISLDHIAHSFVAVQAEQKINFQFHNSLYRKTSQPLNR